ncbi:MAG: sodium:solute symporter [Rhodothermaceae bacterium]
MIIHISVIAGYFLLVMLLSFYTRKLASGSSNEYLVAGKNLGVIVCSIVVAAEWLGGMSTIGVSEKAYTSGTLQPVLYNISTAAGMIIIGFTLAYYYRKNNVHTVSEMLEKLFGKEAKKVSAISFLLAYITLAYVQLQTCASVIAPLFGISWNVAVIASSVVITIYTFWGGMHAIALTGILHITVMILGTGIALFTGITEIGGFAELGRQLAETGAPSDFYNPFSINLSDAFSLLLGGVLGGMAAQASIQPIFAAKNAATAKRAAILSAFIVAPFGIMTAFLGLIARTDYFMDSSAIENAKLVLPMLLSNENFISPVLGGIALAGLLAAILSTVGPVNFAVVTIATKDIYKGFINPDCDDRKLVKVARRLVILVGLLSIPMAIFFRGGILEAAYVSYAIRAIGAIVILFGIYKSGWINEKTVKAAFIYGTISVFLMIAVNSLEIIKIDKTYGAVTVALLIILINKLKPERK